MMNLDIFTYFHKKEEEKRIIKNKAGENLNVNALCKH